MTYTYLADGTKVSAVSGCGYGLKYRGSFVYETGDSMDDCLPFGTRVQNASFAGVDDNRYRYAGKEEQRIGGSDLSLLDFGARYYDPYVARWTSIDPMAYIRMSHNPYLYCSDNPLNYTDKKGLFDIRTGEIQKGDEISSITQLINEKYKLNLTTNDIAKANGLNISDDLKLGSFIKLPGDNVHLAFDLHILQVIDDTYNIELPELS